MGRTNNRSEVFKKRYRHACHDRQREGDCNLPMDHMANIVEDGRAAGSSRVQDSSPRFFTFAVCREKTPTISTWEEYLNWSTGVTLSSL